MCKAIQYLGSKSQDDLEQKDKYGEIPRRVLEQIFVQTMLPNNIEFRFDDFCEVIYGKKLPARVEGTLMSPSRISSSPAKKMKTGKNPRIW